MAISDTLLKYTPEIMLGLPLLSAAIIALFFRRSKWGGALVSILSATLVLAISSLMLLSENYGKVLPEGFEIFALGDLSVKFGFLLDSLSANMIFVVAFVGWLIHIFSVGYMNHDEAKGRFFGGLSFFMFSMTGIMLADNLFMMFIFWEFVGFSSYMLIAHYADTDYSKMASKKAFIANRVGDFGFLIGIIWCYWSLGTTSFEGISLALKANPELASTSMALLLLCGFLGKSAQFPLQVWLTDAMAGPTPVSALIHAATMVAAGVFMTVRLGLVGIMTPTSSAVMLFICALMAMCAGFWALGQSDIKKTLAYSTLAHLGLMGAAVGMGAYGVAMMHLTMHAFFKAGLFLVAGAVIYACHHEQNMFKMGGLFKKMPITALVAILLTCSIISVPFFAGYYSKEMILNISFVNAFGEGATSFNKIVFTMILIAALLTPIYMGRLLWAVFFGKAQSESAEKAKEVSVFMSLPLVVLAIYSIAGAYGVVLQDKLLWIGGKMSGLIPSVSSSFMTEVRGWEHFHHVVESNNSVAVLGYAVLGFTLIAMILSYFVWGKGEDKLEKNLPSFYYILNKHGWFDDVYNYYIAKVQQRFAILLNALDLLLIQGICVRGSALLASLLGMGVDGIHKKWVSSYIVYMILGVILMSLIVIFF